MIRASAAGAFLLAAGLTLSAPAAAQQATESGREVEYLDAGTIFSGDLPFSEAVRVGDMLYLSGMVGVVPGSLELAEGGIRAETRQTMENIGAILKAHGSSLDRVVKCTVFLADIEEWSAFNEVYRTFFEGRYPARSALGTAGLALDARVEVECTATVGPDGDGGNGAGAAGR